MCICIDETTISLIISLAGVIVGIISIIITILLYNFSKKIYKLIELYFDDLHECLGLKDGNKEINEDKINNIKEDIKKISK